MQTLIDGKADLVLVNGYVYTVDDRRRVVEALAVVGKRIGFVGGNTDAKAWIGKGTRVIDLQGKMVLPGFVDSHCHITSGVCEIFEPILHGIHEVAGYQKAIRDFSQTNPKLEGIQAGGWVNALFGPHGPSKEILDEVIPGIPVVLYSEDYHNAWVNSKALESVGISSNTPDPSDGIIERDPGGNPTGTLRESAVELVRKAVPAYTIPQVRKGLAYFQRKAHALGITTVYNPLVSRKELTDMLALRECEEAGEMKLHVPSAVEVEPKDAMDSLDEMIRIRSREQGEYFSINAAKIFMDGVLEGGTAYLEEPYLHKKGNRGILNWDPQKFNRVCTVLDKAGFQIHVHSIGDAATRITLDGFSEARQRNGVRDSRHCITHLQLVHAVDLDRFATLGVIAVVQPYWFLPDQHHEQMLRYIGPERATRQYPMKSFFDRGVVVASASDYNVTLVPNPLVAIEIGVTRRVPDSLRKGREPRYDEVLVPGEHVSVEQMIASFTINGACAAFLEGEAGSLVVGKKADLIVLDQNIMKTSPTQIHQVKVLATFFEGQEVYGEGSLD